MSAVDRVTAMRARLAAPPALGWRVPPVGHDIASHVTLRVGGQDADGFGRNKDDNLPTAEDVALFKDAPADLAYLFDEFGWLCNQHDAILQQCRVMDTVDFERRRGDRARPSSTVGSTEHLRLASLRCTRRPKSTTPSLTTPPAGSVPRTMINGQASPP
jgi:hypothetical protein